MKMYLVAMSSFSRGRAPFGKVAVRAAPASPPAASGKWDPAAAAARRRPAREAGCSAVAERLWVPREDSVTHWGPRGVRVDASDAALRPRARTSGGTPRGHRGGGRRCRFNEFRVAHRLRRRAGEPKGDAHAPRPS